jgi:hypothetical protein
MRYMRTAGQDFTIDDEKSHAFAAAAGPLLGQDTGPSGQESPGRVQGLGFVDDINRDEATG